MTLIKYNEIMENIKVDSDMKSRIMSAVSSSIKEQADDAGTKKPLSDSKNDTGDTHGKVTVLSSGKAPVRKSDIHSKNAGAEETPVRRKASRLPVIISSVAAGVIVLLCVVLIFSNMKKAETKGYNSAGHSADQEQRVAAAPADATDMYEEAEETIAGDFFLGDDKDRTLFDKSKTDSWSDSGHKSDTVGIEAETEAAYGVDGIGDGGSAGGYGLGDERIDRIGRALPFDMKGNGVGVFSDEISEEVFLGVNGEKAILLAGSEGTDLVKAFAPSFKGEGVDGKTPCGIDVKYYRLEFNNVTAPAAEGTTEVNAALFTKNGKTYLLVFSDIQSTDAISKVVDAV